MSEAKLPDEVLRRMAVAYSNWSRSATPHRDGMQAAWLASPGPALAEELADLATRFEQCLITNGTDPEFAAIAVEKTTLDSGEWTLDAGNYGIVHRDDKYNPYIGSCTRKEDAAFIALAHREWPRLVGAVEEVERLRAALEKIEIAARCAPGAMDAGDEEDDDPPDVTAKLIFKGIAHRARVALSKD